VISTHTNAPANITNANYEEIYCCAIKPMYTGTEDNVMPFLLCFDIRHQDEGWATATHINVNDKSYDLTVDFTYKTEEDITDIAHTRWTSTAVQVDKHTIGDTIHAIPG
jgi:hypothetical protein